MVQKLSFYLTVVSLKDENSGDYTSFFAQFPDATAQGRTEEEAKALLYEIFPFMLQDKKEEFMKYHAKDAGRITFTDEKVCA